MPTPLINILFSVDWEGEHLGQVDDIIRLRKEIGYDIPFTHFICPAYFTHRARQNAAVLKNAIFSHDEVALHIHCYRNLVKHCGIGFRSEHDYYRKKIKQGLFDKFFDRLSYQTGRGIPITVYTNTEMEILVKCSRELLQEYVSGHNIQGFRAGGWLANDALLEVLAKLGFVYDSSVVSPAVLSKGYSNNTDGKLVDDYNESYGVFNQMIVDLWGRKVNSDGYLANRLFQEKVPGGMHYRVMPFKYSSGLFELPNNFGMADFTDPEKTIAALLAENLLPENFYISYGCHQEGDYFFKQKLAVLKNMLKTMCGVQPNYLTHMQYIKQLNVYSNKI